jgi:hypothetical protein
MGESNAKTNRLKLSGRIFIGGLVEGINYPKGKNSPIVDLRGCNDIIIVDSNYFLKNKALLEAWASKK